MSKHEPKNVSEKTLIKKIGQSFKLIGHEAIYHALLLYFTLQSPNTPAWCKTVVLGSLGYFISLIDGIPDLTPFLGYTDDVALMAATIAAISTYITPEIQAKAKEKQEQLFGPASTNKQNTPNTPPSNTDCGHDQEPIKKGTNSNRDQ